MSLDVLFETVKTLTMLTVFALAMPGGAKSILSKWPIVTKGKCLGPVKKVGCLNQKAFFSSG